MWFGYDSPQRVCEECIPQLFDCRQQSDVPESASISIVRCTSSPQISRDGFQTSGEEVLSFPLRFLHPLCRFAFWFSGMYEGGSFNRTFLNTAANMNLPFIGDPVKSIIRTMVPVPKQWPSYGDDSWETYSVSNIEEPEMSEIPVFIFTPLTTSTRPLPVLVCNKAKPMIFVNQYYRYGSTVEAFVWEVQKIWFIRLSADLWPIGRIV